MQKFYTSGKSYDKDLYDQLFFNYLNLNEISNNDEIINKFTLDIDKVLNKKHGFGLFTIDIKKQSYNILLVSTITYSTDYAFCYINKQNKDIDVGTIYKCEQIKDDNLYEIINDLSTRNRKFNETDIVELLLVKTLTGYRINKSNAINIIDNITNNIYDLNTHQMHELNSDIPLNKFNEYFINYKDDLNQTFSKLVNKYKLTIKNNISIDNINKLPNEETSSYYHNDCYCSINKLNKVEKINNNRFVSIETYIGTSINTYKSTCTIYKYRPTTKSSDSSNIIYQTDTFFIIPTSATYNDSVLSNLPYNYIDEGRYVINIGNSNRYKYTVITTDPKINEFNIDQVLQDSLKWIMSNNINIDSIYIEYEKNTIYLSNYTNKLSIINKKELLKAMKSFNDEFKYVVKKQKAAGDDIKITDNILYKHATGEISYNDFAIALDDESFKHNVQRHANNLLIQYYRKDITEEEIIKQLSEYTFNFIENIISSTNKFREINLTFNKNVNIIIELLKGDGHLTYINGCRINKNEIVNLLKEISCYTSQDSADKFIKNITKKGLSVFIGLSSGFFYSKKFYKFKTGEKSGYYIMSIDGVDINIKGKKVFNTLYNICILKNRTTSRGVTNTEFINNHVFKSTLSKFDYIKYKIMIDKSYQLFIDNSKKFLDKKVKELGAEYVKYHDNNQNKEYDAIKLTGTSGKQYIIAYDLKESFVFMNAEYDKTETSQDDNSSNIDIYKNGIYICMIDQSKMKATVGFDTVVSKLLSLKNDSVIASTIYNLEDELNKG